MPQNGRNLKDPHSAVLYSTIIEKPLSYYGSVGGSACQQGSGPKQIPSSSYLFSTGPRWLLPPKIMQPADLLYVPGFGSSHLYRQRGHAYDDTRKI
jgi:hypothetical protein